MRMPNRIMALALFWALLLLPAAARAQGSVQVTLPNGMSGGFSSVQGLESQTREIQERRDSGGGVFAPIKMPGLGKYGNVTLLQGSFANNSQAWELVSQVRMNTATRGTVTISVGNMEFILNNAWPVAINTSGTSSDGGAMRVERLELAYETLEVRYQ